MQIIRDESDLEKIKRGAVLTIGNFDGVHIGHQAILSVAKRIAGQRQAELVAMTFQPHPLSILNPEKAPESLMPAVLKERLLAEFGAGILFAAKSEPELLSLAAEDFVERFIVKGIRPIAIVEGEDFNFGRKRTGTVHTLQKLAGARGIEVVIVEPKKAKLANGETVEVSSTEIRNMIKEGKVADAAVLLSKPYRLIGNIVSGRGKGKQLGFPTLNMDPTSHLLRRAGKPGQLIPAEGVYAGLVEIGDSESDVCLTRAKIPAAFSIGRAATYGANQSLLIEAHLLIDNVEQFTGRWMAMDFIERIRGQQKFGSEKELVEQIDKDCRKARQILCSVVA
ncbi:MAG: riboflavin biosynthesis protein RibF [Phycisphaerae bacterium]|nr:riboflavin biosynthesis protein RibF [Phycisphaerae bacterium]